MDLHARKPLECGGGDEIVLADAGEGRIRVEAAEDRMANGRGHDAGAACGSRTSVQRTSAPSRSSTPRQLKKGVSPTAAPSAPILSESTSPPPLPHVPAIPATVATSLRLNRSDAMVITVTESVWCAKPPRHNSAIAVYGLSTNPTNAIPV